jgi:hypothetical protein
VTPKRVKTVAITLTGAMNNQFGREEKRYHCKSGDTLICPVRAARWVYKAAAFFGTRESETALKMRRGDITSGDSAKVIKQAARIAGLDPARFSTHSVRIGGATALLNSLSSKGSADMSRQMC